MKCTRIAVTRQVVSAAPTCSLYAFFLTNRLTGYWVVPILRHLNGGSLRAVSGVQASAKANAFIKSVF